VRFAFTDDQLLLRDAVRDYLAKEYTAVQVREAWDTASAPTPAEGRLERPVWSALAEMGVVGLLVPEADGGMGMDVLDQVLLLEETGRVALADPIVETAAVAAPLLSELAPSLNRADWLTAIVSGWSTVAVDIPVDGVAVPFVVDADRADLLVAGRGDRLVAVASGALTTVAQPSVDGARRLFEVSWAPSAEIVLAEGEAASTALAAAFDRGALGSAAQLVGLADRALELTVDYVKERRQFGVPIGSFQAVKHHLADALLQLEFARPVVHRAAYSIATGAPGASRDVSMAKAYASDAALLVARKALQCHGAIGYTVEYDLHLWMKRIWALAAAWGDARWHRERVAATLLGPRPTH
jgi:alkylation response protein AidB-like acyl-CoA dehydrogenase